MGARRIVNPISFTDQLMYGSSFISVIKQTKSKTIQQGKCLERPLFFFVYCSIAGNPYAGLPAGSVPANKMLTVDLQMLMSGNKTGRLEGH